jgi:ribonuclease HI
VGEGTVEIYTDGSCHTQMLNGAWAAIIICAGKKIIIKGTDINTTHHRMELLAVLKAIEFLQEKKVGHMVIRVYSDSQYVVGLPSRKQKLKDKDFRTKGGNVIANADLLARFFELLDINTIEFFKLKSHAKNGPQLNHEVDLLVRQLVRDHSN